MGFAITFPTNIKVASALFLQNGMTSLKVEVAGSVLLPQNGTTCRSTTHWLPSTAPMSLSVSPTSQLEMKLFLTKGRRIQRARHLREPLPLIFPWQRARNGEPPVAAKCLQWPLWEGALRSLVEYWCQQNPDQKGDDDHDGVGGDGDGDGGGVDDGAGDGSIDHHIATFRHSTSLQDNKIISWQWYLRQNWFR